MNFNHKLNKFYIASKDHHKIIIALILFLSDAEHVLQSKKLRILIL